MYVQYSKCKFVYSVEPLLFKLPNEDTPSPWNEDTSSSVYSGTPSNSNPLTWGHLCVQWNPTCTQRNPLYCNPLIWALYRIPWNDRVLYLNSDISKQWNPTYCRTPLFSNPPQMIGTAPQNQNVICTIFISWMIKVSVWVSVNLFVLI